MSFRHKDAMRQKQILREHWYRKGHEYQSQDGKLENTKRLIIQDLIAIHYRRSLFPRDIITMMRSDDAVEREKAMAFFQGFFHEMVDGWLMSISTYTFWSHDDDDPYVLSVRFERRPFLKAKSWKKLNTKKTSNTDGGSYVDSIKNRIRRKLGL